MTSSAETFSFFFFPIYYVFPPTSSLLWVFLLYRLGWWLKIICWGQMIISIKNIENGKQAEQKYHAIVHVHNNCSHGSDCVPCSPVQ